MVILEQAGGLYAFSVDSILVTPWLESKEAAIASLARWRAAAGYP